MTVHANTPVASLHPPATLAPAEHAALGKRARDRSPRTGAGDWRPSSRRANPLALLARQDAGRIAELVPIRYGRMSASPFAFFRGGAAVMASDLAGSPDSGFGVQLSGDAHLANFGVYAAPDRAIVFDLNDFDETLPGPWEWDVKRLVASFEILGRERGWAETERQEAVEATARTYRESMRTLASLGNLEVFYARLDVTALLAELSEQAEHQHIKSPELKAAEKRLRKAHNKGSSRAVSRLTHLVDGELRFVSDPPLIVPVSELWPGAAGEQIEREILAKLVSYRDSLAEDRRRLLESYRYVDLARKVVGVGSVGTRSWVMLMLGRDESDPLVLQIKQASESVLEPYLGASTVDPGRRVVEGQRLMQAASDVLLGHLVRTDDAGITRYHYVRQLWDGKGSPDTETMTPAAARIYARICGWTLARAHARSGDRMAIAGYLGKGDEFDRAMVRFAGSYADQNERDFEMLAEAIAKGRIAAETGV